MVNGNRNTIIYHYDDLNQLARVDDRAAQRTWTYTYDAGGNILSKSEYEFTQLETLNENSLISRVNYTYSDGNWGDLLIGWGDKTVTSDEIGNMLSDGTWSYTWQHGRQLKSMTNGSTTINYEYDASGMRTKKTVGNKTWTYVYNGSTLSYMTDGTNKLFFSYDANGPMAVKYNGVDYYYVQNAQGDIITLVNSSGAEVVTYTYGPWGELLSTGGSMATTLGQINPLTYRGYVYDRETGLYYLQSRYYNPEMCRFINTDSRLNSGSILGYNMFAYCENNPINHIDPDGHFFKKIWEGIKAKWSNTKKKAKSFANKVGRTIKAAYDSIESNIGIGMGIGGKLSGSIGPVNAELDVSASNIVYAGVDDGQFGTGNRVSASAYVTLMEIIKFGPRYNKGHLFSDEDCTCIPWGQETSSYYEMSKCPASQVNTTDDMIIGGAIGAYFILGGEVTLGFNVSEFIERVVEIYGDEEE